MPQTFEQHQQQRTTAGKKCEADAPLVVLWQAHPAQPWIHDGGAAVAVVPFEDGEQAAAQPKLARPNEQVQSQKGGTGGRPQPVQHKGKPKASFVNGLHQACLLLVAYRQKRQRPVYP